MEDLKSKVVEEPTTSEVEIRDLPIQYSLDEGSYIPVDNDGGYCGKSTLSEITTLVGDNIDDSNYARLRGGNAFSSGSSIFSGSSSLIVQNSAVSVRFGIDVQMQYSARLWFYHAYASSPPNGAYGIGDVGQTDYRLAIWKHGAGPDEAVINGYFEHDGQSEALTDNTYLIKKTCDSLYMEKAGTGTTSPFTVGAAVNGDQAIQRDQLAVIGDFGSADAVPGTAKFEYDELNQTLNIITANPSKQIEAAAFTINGSPINAVTVDSNKLNTLKINNDVIHQAHSSVIFQPSYLHDDFFNSGFNAIGSDQYGTVTERFDGINMKVLRLTSSIPNAPNENVIYVMMYIEEVDGVPYDGEALSFSFNGIGVKKKSGSNSWEVLTEGQFRGNTGVNGWIPGVTPSYSSGLWIWNINPDNEDIVPYWPMMGAPITKMVISYL